MNFEAYRRQHLSLLKLARCWVDMPPLPFQQAQVSSAAFVRQEPSLVPAEDLQASRNGRA